MIAAAAWLDRIFDTFLGGIEADRHDPRAAAARAPFAALSSETLFTDVIRLQANNPAEAHAAVLLQLDRLLPFEPGAAAWDVVGLDPVSLPDMDGSARRRFLLAAVPLTQLDTVRAHRPHGRLIEGFVAEHQADGTTVRIVLRDAKAVEARRQRRQRLVIAALGSLVAFYLLGEAVGRRMETAGAGREAVAEARAAALAAADARTLPARALSQQVLAAGKGDTLNVADRVVTLLSRDPLPGFAIEKLEAEGADVRLSGYSEDGATVADALRARKGFASLQVAVSATPDPFGRGDKVDARFSPTAP